MPADTIAPATRAFSRARGRHATQQQESGVTSCRDSGPPFSLRRPSSRAHRRPCSAAGHRHAGFAGRDHDGEPRAAPRPRPEVRWRDQGRRAAVEGMVGAAHRAAEGRAERAARHHRRRRLRRAEHLRRRHPDADDGPHRERGAALQPHVLHGALLADARRTHHRAQSSFGRLRRDLGAVDRLPRLQQHHPARTRPPSAACCSTTATPRRGSARTTTRRRSRRARSDRSTSGRPAWASSTSTASSAATRTSGSRTCSATRRRSIRSRASRDWNLVTGMADDAIDYMTRIHQTDPSKPIFIKYAPGATHAPHHPTQEWVDKIHAMHLFDDGYEKLRERIFENQKKLGLVPKDARLTPWPSDDPEALGPAHGRREEALHPPGRGVRRLRGLQRPRDRARDPGLRGPGQTRQHARHLHQRRQRHQRRGRAARHAERGRVLQRRE